MDAVEQAIRDAHANGKREAEQEQTHRFALELAQAQFENADRLAKALRRTIGQTPAIYIPPALTSEIERVQTTVKAALKVIEKAKQDA